MRFTCLLLLIAVASAETQPCKMRFSVIWKDSLNNVTQGLSKENEKWMREKMAKKYPDVCYRLPTERPPLVLWISMAPATYHGSKTVSNSGTVRDTTPGSDTYGQVVGRTETDQEVPYSVDYTVYTMSLEQQQADGSWKVLHNFRHNNLQKRMYGLSISNRHPKQALIEQAIRWMHNGGLDDSLQTVLPPNPQQ